VFGDQGERRAGDCLHNPHSLTNALCQAGLARSQLAFQAYQISRSGKRPKPYPKPMGLLGTVTDKVKRVLV
jgi:hypothetical protein